MLPSGPINRRTKPILQFLHIEAPSGGVLLLATVVALILANSPAAERVEHFRQTWLSVSMGSVKGFSASSADSPMTPSAPGRRHSGSSSHLDSRNYGS